MRKKYLNNRFLMLLLLLLTLLLPGCTDNEIKTLTEPKQQDTVKQSEGVKTPEQKIIPSFSIKTYSTPFIEFDYPADWDESDEGYFYEKDTIKVIIGDMEKGTCITVKQKFDKSINSADQARTEFIELCDSMQNIEYIDKESFLNGNIAILEGIVYGRFEAHAKEYFWNNGDGKTYQIEISTNNDNWDNLREIIQVFEQSIKFKK